jgi:crotonobetainyl-CoA:carnitine CoA-transferase CaiB-like acyl-CoA transferase
MKVLICYYGTYGNVYKMANLVAEGVSQVAGAEPVVGAGGKLKFTISSPIQIHGVAKVPAKRAPEIGEHNEEILGQLGFSATDIEGFRARRAIPGVKHPEVVATGGGR